MATLAPARIRDLFITGLRNAHALENQALAMMNPQVARLTHYPDVADRLRTHIAETNKQIARLDAILAELGSSTSLFKDMTMGIAGGMAAMGNSLAGDEILKTSFANYAFEHFEIASYRSLVALAEDGGFDRAASLLRQSLLEEEAMAQWIEDNLLSITRRYAQRYEQEGQLTAKA